MTDELPIENNRSIDVFAVKEGGGAQLLIVPTGPLTPGPEIQSALLAKVEGYLAYINSKAFSEECGPPSIENTEVVIRSTYPVDQKIRQLIAQMLPWVQENNASILLDVGE